MLTDKKTKNKEKQLYNKESKGGFTRLTPNGTKEGDVENCQKGERTAADRLASDNCIEEIAIVC